MMIGVIRAEGISEAYVKTLTYLLRDKGNPYYLITEIEYPIRDGELNLHPKIDEIYRNFKFSDGRMGNQWIEDRVKALIPKDFSPRLKPLPKLRKIFSSYSYWERLTEYGKKVGLQGEEVNSINQLECVATRLWYKRNVEPRIVGNHQTCVILDPRKDLYGFLISPRSVKPDIPCLTLIDFKTDGDKLHILSIWRAQYFDTKAYGNWISLAILLKKMCDKTGYAPGELISIACKAIFDNKNDAVKLLNNLINVYSSEGAQGL